MHSSILWLVRVNVVIFLVSNIYRINTCQPYSIDKQGARMQDTISLKLLTSASYKRGDISLSAHQKLPK